MAIYYNMSNVTAANNWYDLVYSIEQLSGNTLGVWLWLTLYVVMLIVFVQRSDIKEAAVSTSFLMGFISLILGILKLLDPKWVLLTWLLAAFSGWLLYHK